MRRMTSEVRPIQWRDGALILLDQTRLPHDVIHLEYHTATEVAEAIRSMVVRGAPAIGVTAAFGMVLAVASDPTPEAVARAATMLRQARPTAVNLGWAIDRMLRCYQSLSDHPAADRLPRMEQEAMAIMQEDLDANRRIGRYGAELLGASSRVLTHCNAGALATAGYGTALGVVRAAHDAGKKIAVFADETRPFLQGARLTAWELQQDGIDVTLITDNMSGHLFQKGMVDAVLVGADRIAANGDTANKIGTYMVAVLAHAHDVPFYVAAPLSTIDAGCEEGSSIPIEERSADEVTHASGWDDGGTYRRVSIAPRGVAARHPAFDVTPARLITAIITDRGVARPPFRESIATLLSQPGA